MLKKLLLAGALVALFSASAHAAPAVVASAGPRVGFSVDPDQLVLGGHLVMAEVAPDLSFNPNLEFGFGDDVSLIAVNFDLHYHLRLQNSDWTPYFGVGVGVVFTDRDRPSGDVSDTDVGGGIILGAGVPTRSANRFFGEMRFGLSSDPSLKLLAGWNFRL